MAERANITPIVLKWARESAKMSEDVAASKVSVEIEKLQEWENGLSQPTIKQAQNLAKAYKRPFALFFLPEPPTDFQPLQDFRNRNAKPLGTASIFIIRELQQKQEWMREFFHENKEENLPFVGKFSTENDPTKVAKDILQTLQIDPNNYRTDNPLREWIAKSEASGIFVSRTSFIHSRMTLDSEEMQGFAIADEYAPFVFINSEDWDSSQLFTLVHELAHIWIAASGISNEIIPQSVSSNLTEPIEIFCNEVSASALMPLSVMNKMDTSIFSSHERIFRTAKTLGVSSLAFLFRAYKLRMISLDQYRSLKRESDKEFALFVQREAAKKEAAQKKSKGGPSPLLLLANRNGKLFTQAVMDAFRGGLIQPTHASNLLNTQVTNFHRLLAKLY